MSYVSRYELRLAYEDCIRRKHNTDNAVNFEIDDNEKIESLYYELNTMTYTIGKSIVFTLLDIKGHAYREVFAADFKDRIVHHLLVNRLIDYMNKYDLIDDNYACRKEKGTLYGAKRCQYKLIQCSNNGKEKNTTIIKGDFKNFFNSLNKEMIYNKLEKFIIQYMSDDRNMIFNLYLCKLIVMHCPQHDGNYIRKQPLRFWNGLPEHKCMFNCDDNHSIAVGNLTSQIFANFYLSLFDHYIVDILGYKYYGRYVDDWYIITNDIDNIGINYRKIREFANSMDLTINVNKTYIQNYKHGVNFIGFMIYHNRMYIRNSTKKKFMNMVYKFNNEIYYQYLCKGKYPDLKYVQKIIPKWNSYLGMFKHCKAYNIWKNVLKKNTYFNKGLMYIIEFDRFGFMRLNKQCKQLLKDNILYGKNEITLER